MIHNSVKISIVAAIGKNRELGKDNKLLWHISEDLKWFKEITKGHPIVMGRKTFESIGRVLPGRANIVITRNTEGFLHKVKKDGHDIQHLLAASSLEDAIDAAKREEGGNEIMIIGGGQIFEQAMHLADRLYLTVVDAAFDADTFFPLYDQFDRIISSLKRHSDEYNYQFLTLEK